MVQNFYANGDFTFHFPHVHHLYIDYVNERKAVIRTRRLLLDAAPLRAINATANTVQEVHRSFLLITLTQFNGY